MTIKDQADQIVERYRPYALYNVNAQRGKDGFPNGWITISDETRNATLCAIKEVEANMDLIERVRDWDLATLNGGGDLNEVWLELTAILNELKSRI